MANGSRSMVTVDQTVEQRASLFDRTKQLKQESFVEEETCYLDTEFNDDGSQENEGDSAPLDEEPANRYELALQKVMIDDKKPQEAS